MQSHEYDTFKFCLLRVPEPGSNRIIGDRALVPDRGDSLLLHRCRRSEVGDLVKKLGAKREEDDDLRTLPLAWTKQGERNRSGENVIEMATEKTLGIWPLSGPRTTLWFRRHMLRNGGTPSPFHSRVISRRQHGGYRQECARAGGVLGMSGSAEHLNIGNISAP